ncbi:diaminopimelate decarboxylase [Candidatus Dependentiae bacterium]|nr:diaminopimelate decarboxylase [Candidatus Dependentiae bacterium]
MNNLKYKNNELYLEDVSLSELAGKYGTPLYVYSKSNFLESYNNIKNSLKNIDHLICFSVKTCSNINLIKLIKNHGAGCDIVSGGELYRALKAGVESSKIVYAGVGKTEEEIRFALKSDILMFNCESVPEIELIDSIAGLLKKKAKIAVRVNPDVDAHTHAKITTGKKENKFGINIDIAPELYTKISKYKNVIPYGIHCHIGSQITEVEPFEKALTKLLKTVELIKKRGINLKTLNIGGGLGIQYKPEQKPIDVKAFGQMVINKIQGIGMKLILEPGRYIAGNSGLLLIKTVYVKDIGIKKFIITDGAMNDLIRPTLYEAYHHIMSVKKTGKTGVFDIVGPVCESGDYFAKERKISCVKQNEYLAVLSSGAYGFSMSSNYNSRPRTAEILVDGNKSSVIRKRETYDDLISLEKK